MGFEMLISLLYSLLGFSLSIPQWLPQPFPLIACPTRPPVASIAPCCPPVPAATPAANLPHPLAPFAKSSDLTTIVHDLAEDPGSGPPRAGEVGSFARSARSPWAPRSHASHEPLFSYSLANCPAYKFNPRAPEASTPALFTYSPARSLFSYSLANGPAYRFNPRAPEISTTALFTYSPARSLLSYSLADCLACRFNPRAPEISTRALFTYSSRCHAPSHPS